MFRLDKKKKWQIMMGSIILVILFIGYKMFFGETHTKVDESIEDDTMGTIEEMHIEYIGMLEAEEEEYFGYSKNSLEMNTFWWQIFSENHYQYLEDRLGIEKENFEFDFVNHYYLISYGRAVEKLYCDSTKMYNDTVRGKVPGAKTEWNDKYISGVVYVYETDKVALVDIEWN